jgi:hypothetical protein
MRLFHDWLPALTTEPGLRNASSLPSSQPGPSATQESSVSAQPGRARGSRLHTCREKRCNLSSCVHTTNRLLCSVMLCARRQTNARPGFCSTHRTTLQLASCKDFLMRMNYGVDFKKQSSRKWIGVRGFSKTGKCFFFLMKIVRTVLPPRVYFPLFLFFTSLTDHWSAMRSLLGRNSTRIMNVNLGTWFSKKPGFSCWLAISSQVLKNAYKRLELLDKDNIWSRLYGFIARTQPSEPRYIAWFLDWSKLTEYLRCSEPKTGTWNLTFHQQRFPNNIWKPISTIIYLQSSALLMGIHEKDGSIYVWHRNASISVRKMRNSTLCS